MLPLLGIVLMLIAASLAATASVLQRRVTKTEPDSASFSLRMILDLARQPVWFLGILAMLSGFVLHGVAIALAPIVLVQPLLITELPFTLLLASWTFGVAIPRRDWASVGMQSLGLAAFIACLAPSGGDPRVPVTTWALGIAANLAVVMVLVVLGYRARQEYRAALLGVATGSIFGLNSALIAGVATSLAHGEALLATWQTYGVAIVGPLSFFLLQNALQAGNLIASQPGFTLTNPLTAVTWGIVVFGEDVRGGLFLIGTFAGAALIVAGTITLVRSPMLNPATTAVNERGG